MRDDLYIGETPSAEPCAQVGSDGYWQRAKAESRAFIAQLRRINGVEPPGTQLHIAENPHDFGTYLSVNCQFDGEDEASVNYAYRCEGEGCPEHWDEEARRELGLLPTEEVNAGHEAKPPVAPLPRFDTGPLLSTPGALAAFERSGEHPLDYLRRHVNGDWGELDEQDRLENERSVEQGNRILSSYKLTDGTKVWVITEADRSSTTFLLPEEY